MTTAQVVGREIRIRGTVQGVGFRPWVYRIAKLAGIAGRVWNDAAGVVVDAFGDEPAVADFVQRLHNPPPAARITEIEIAEVEPDGSETFTIVHSNHAGAPQVSIPPDLATCEECVAEIFDPTNRRYRYPFTNCTNCGPRFTIATDIPYDRVATTMAPFEMCEPCRREYDNPDDRRFHAQPNACPDCGPRLTVYTPEGDVVHADDPIVPAAVVLRDGLIVAAKGVGGFHLACDATNDAAVRRLRTRKHRDEKPLAIMVRDVGEAERLVHLGPAERALLTGVERPIVLGVKRDGIEIAPSVAPNNRMLGVMLPYSPLHHLLLADVGRPLVMTSGNHSDEPIATDNIDALNRLGSIADLTLTHDRDIAMRCDDSVACAIEGRPVLLRRSRGYVPRPIPLVRPLRHTVLGCGALLKNAFCLGSGDSAWFGPHIGDLDDAEAFAGYQDAVHRMQGFLELTPAVVAHDLHPDYQSTRYALRLDGVTRVPVQHHHAHVVSAMTEHGLDGPVIGLAYDGTGFGTDGTMWGGEVLRATTSSYERVATFRTIRLPGGERAIREPWRSALALVADAFGGELPPEVRQLFDYVATPRFAAVRKLLLSDVSSPLARGVGRYFDAFGSLFLKRDQAAFEGQIALEWNQVAEPRVMRAYPFAIAPGQYCAEIDLRPAMKTAIEDFLAGDPAGTIAAAFHNTLAEATAQIVRSALDRHGHLPVVASGGCFQNARLAETITASLEPECRVHLHGLVPPGDGGIALGQVVIAGALCA
jgi:hydrogenase maturation protein HypF